jgi:5'-nucleotidase
VGAALTGGLNGAWGLAVSLDVGMNPTEFHWDAAASAAVGVLPFLLGTPRGTVMNLNAPNTADSRGVVEARLAPFGIVQTTLAERDAGRIRLAVEDLPNSPEPGTDAALLADGWVTITGLEAVSAVALGYDRAAASPASRR